MLIHHRLFIALSMASALSGHARRSVSAQEAAPAAAARPPRFLLANGSGIVPIDLDRSPVLAARISLSLDGVTLKAALATIGRESGVRLVFTDDLLPNGRRVQLKAEAITVAAALTDVLFGSGLDVVFNRTGEAALVRRAAPPPAPLVGTVAGRVTDATSGQPVPLAQVTVVGTTLGRSTDEGGRYAITGVPAGEHQVNVRRVGYAPLTRPVNVTDGGTATADFALVRAPTSLEEVVTTVTGQQARYKVGNAIGSVAVDSVMKEAPVTNINDLLSGRVPGLQIYNAGGYSGATSLIRIRGTNSFTVSNDPIVIIDGVRVEGSPGVNAPLGTTTVSGTFRQFRSGRMADLSAYEIESIDVVKGPSAATLYGSDAANGVIVIRTKKGSATAPRWQFWSEQGTLRPLDHFNPGYWAYGTNLTTGAQQQCALPAVAAGVCRQDSIVAWNNLEDPATSPMATGSRKVYGVQVRGGVQNFTYFLSGESSDETGFLRMPDAEQARVEQLRGVTSLPKNQVRPNDASLLNLRANLGTSLGDKAHVQLSNGLVFNTTSIPGAAIFQSGAFHNAPPTTNGGWFGSRPGEQFAITAAEATSRLSTSLSGDYQPAEWLSTRATVGLDGSGSIEEGLQKNGEGPAATITGQRQDNRYDIKVWSVDANATATRTLPWSMTSRTSVGTQYNRRREFDVLTYGSNLAPGSVTLAGAAATATQELTTETIVAGAYGDQTIAIRDRLFLNAAVRFDGGSAFGSAFKTVAYPKASVSWLAVDGSGPRRRWIDNLRLRAAIGSSGVQPSAVASLQRDCLAQAFVNGVAVTGATLCQLGNARLKPETQTEFETGIDGEMLQSRLKVELTYYNRESRNAISSITVGPSANTITVIGSAAATLSVPVNLGSVRNRGLEGAVNARVFDWKQTSLDLGLSGNVNENRLVTLGPGVPFTPTSNNQPGYPLNSRFQRRYTFSDADGNGIITNNEVTLAANPSWMGAVHPQNVFTGTAALGLFNETLRLSAMGDSRSRSIITDFTEINNCIFLTCRSVVDPKASLADQAASRAQALGSSAGFVYSGRFISLREVSATWFVPRSITSRFRANGAQLSVSGRNLGVYLTKCGCYSVESTQSIPTDNLGPQNPGAPMPRYLIFRLTLDY